MAPHLHQLSLTRLRDPRRESSNLNASNCEEADRPSAFTSRRLWQQMSRSRRVEKLRLARTFPQSPMTNLPELEVRSSSRSTSPQSLPALLAPAFLIHYIPLHLSIHSHRDAHTSHAIHLTYLVSLRNSRAALLSTSRQDRNLTYHND